MDHTTNLPTFLATSAAPLFYAAADHLAGRPLPEGFALGPGAPGALVLCRGRAELSLPAALVAQLGGLGPRKASGVLRLAPRALAACFEMARRDYLEGRMADGRLALHNKYDIEGSGSKGLGRLCAHLGARADDPGAQARALGAVRALEACTLVRRGKAGGEPLVVEGLLSIEQGPVRLGAIEERGRRHRGGAWRAARIHPGLFGLAFDRFIRMPAGACELGPKQFAVWLAAAGQAAARGGARAQVSQARLLRDAGLEETARAGRAREVRALEGCLRALEAKGLVVAGEAPRGSVALSLPHLERPVPKAKEGPKPQTPAAKPQTPAAKPQALAAATSETTNSGGETTNSGGETTKRGNRVIRKFKDRRDLGVR